MAWMDKVQELLADKDKRVVVDAEYSSEGIADDLEHEYDEDPPPGTPVRKLLKKKTPSTSETASETPTRRRTPVRRRRPGARTAVVKEASDDVQTAIEMLAFVWGLTGDHCAQVFEDNSKNITKALMKILSRNPALLERLQESGILWDSIALGTALMPVAKSVYKHHVRKEEIDGGEDDLGDFPAYVPGAGSLGVGRAGVPGVMG